MRRRPRALAPWCGHRLPAGTRLRVLDTGAGRTATLGVHGLDVPRALGSASTYARSGLGGVEGRALGAGDALRCAAPASGDGPASGAEPERRVPEAAVAELAATLLGHAPPGAAFATIHAVPGAAGGRLRAAGARALLRRRRLGRVGGHRPHGHPARGPCARPRRRRRARDIVSDAIVPGSVQVPGTGLPIVLLLRDAHTAGGYPKIATLASADLAAVALARPGARLRMVRTDVAGAVRRTRRLSAAVELALSRAVPALIPPDTARLLSVNLVDGVTDGRGPDDPTPRSPACE